MRDTSGLISLSNRKIIFLVTLFMGLLVASPLWTHKIYYLDDYYRLIDGDNLFWMSNGRPLTTLINMLLRFSFYSNDITPLPLILGLMFLSIAATLYVEKLNLRLNGLWQCLPPLLIVLNPFLVQPFLYAFDSITMLIAISVSLLACISWHYTFFNRLVLTTLLLLIMLTTYQIGLNIFMSGLAVMTLKRWVEREPLRNFLLEKIAGCIIALFVYKFAIADVFVKGIYSTKHSEFISLGGNTLEQLSKNTTILYNIFITAFPGLKALFIIVPLLLALLGIAVIMYNKIVESRLTLAEGFTTGFLLLLVPLIVTLSIPGISLLLAYPTNQIRVFPTYSVFALFCFYVSVTAFPRVKYWISGLQIITAFYCLVLMVSCFNAIVNDQSYTFKTMERIKSDLAHLPSSKITDVAFIDRLRPSPDIITTLNNFPLARNVRNT